MTHVVAIVIAKPGMREAFLRGARANIQNVLTENGCLEYCAAADAEGFGDFQTKIGKGTFVFIEKWESPDALKTHAAAPHMLAYAAKTKHLVANRVIHILSPH